MTALPPLPPPDIWVREDFGLGDSTVHQGYTPQEVEAIRRETVEACIARCEAVAQRHQEQHHSAAEIGADECAIDLRALLEKQP